MNQEFNRDKARDEIALGEQARFLKDNDAYQKAWNAVQAGLADLRAKCPITDKEQAQALIMCERMTLKFKKALEDFIATGKFASDQLKLENERQSRLDKLMPPWMRKKS